MVTLDCKKVRLFTTVKKIRIILSICERTKMDRNNLKIGRRNGSGFEGFYD